MNVYENQILHSSILSFDPVIRKREINAAGMPGDPRKGNPNAVPVIETYPGYEVFEDGSMETLLKSLKRLYALEGDYEVYPGHADATTLDRERRFNFYMQRAIEA